MPREHQTRNVVMNENYDRLAAENKRLRERVNALEHAVFDLQRKFYALQTQVKGREITEYLENYKSRKP